MLSDLSQSLGLRGSSTSNHVNGPLVGNGVPLPGPTSTSGVTSSNAASAAAAAAAAAAASGSPAKQVGSLLSRASSLTSSVSANMVGVAGRLSSGIKELGGRSKTLLVIDDAGCEWARYFRSRRLAGEFEIRVEQAHFSELATTAHTEQGILCTVYQVERGVPRAARHFRPDFVLIRQHIVDAQRDSRAVLLALQYAQVPAVNSLHCAYNFVDRPWVVRIESSLST
jgi:hypothetical protein